MAVETANSDSKSIPPLFLHAQFEVPPVAGDRAGDGDVGNSIAMEIGDGDGADNGQSIKQSAIVTEQYFDASNCNSARIGLPDGVEPTKPEPGDYSYSGMHDHGPLPPPKEGGQFAQIIGFVSAAKKASDAYLTEVIEKEKTVNASAATEQKIGQQKRKRKEG